MRIQHGRLARGLRRLAEGQGAVWAPQVTTSQREHADLLVAVDSLKAQAATGFLYGDWKVNYTADELPQDDTPAWTEELLDSPSRSVSGGVLTVDNTGATKGVWWHLHDADLDAGAGVVLEARVRVRAGTSAPNQGLSLVICDGAHRFVAWLRKGGGNIQGQAGFAADLSRWRRLRFEVWSDCCRLYVDGALRQIGTYIAATADQYIAFGSCYIP